MGPIAAVGPIAMGLMPLDLMGAIAAGTVVVVCEPTPLGPIADGLVAVRAGLVPPGPGVVAGVKLDSASAGIPHRYVPLHHGDAVV